ncbi:MAG: response regulator [Verrucomicrobiota bacterium]
MKKPAKPAKPAARRTPVLLVDDHPITRQGLATLIAHEEDLEVCGEVADAASAQEAVGRLRPGLVLVDLSLPGRSGLELIKDLNVTHPGLPTLVLSMHDEALYAERALRAGARGYLMKSAGGRAVVEAIRRVLGGQISVSPAVSERIMESLAGARPAAPDARLASLSDREFEIFQLIGQGLGTRQIAGRLNLSIKTIEAHRAHLKDKLGVPDAPALVHEAVRWVQSQQQVG